MEICFSANSSTDQTTADLLRPTQSTSTIVQAATSSVVLYWHNCHKAGLLFQIIQFGIESMGTGEGPQSAAEAYLCAFKW